MTNHTIATSTTTSANAVEASAIVRIRLSLLASGMVKALEKVLLAV